MGDSPQPSTTITHNGFFDSAALTNAIRDWYLKNDYFVQVPSHKQEIKETGRKYDQDWKGEKKMMSKLLRMVKKSGQVRLRCL